MSEEKFEVPAKFKDLVEKIEQLPALELSELVKVLEQRFGVSAAAIAAPVVAGVAGASASGGEAVVEEKTSFVVVLKGVGPQKIQVIKVVRELTGKGLKESKDLVDGAPKTVAEGVDKARAEEMKKKLEEAGATVELQ